MPYPIKKNYAKQYCLIVCLFIFTSMLACSFSDSAIENAISRTQTALPTSTATETLTLMPTTTPTLIPTFTPALDPVATETPIVADFEPKFSTLSEALVSIDQLVVFFDDNFKLDIPDFSPIGLGNDCQIDCAARWIAGRFDTFDLIIELDQATSEAAASAAVEDLNSEMDQWNYIDYPAIDWGEYELPEDWQNKLPDNYYSGYLAFEDLVEAVAITSYGPVVFRITVLDYEMGWADYPNILLLVTTVLQINNLMEMRFE